MYKRLGLALFFGAAALCAEEVKLMFGGREDPGGGEKFLDFRYVSQKDPLFTVKTKLEGWNYNPRGGATYGSFSAGSLPADQILEHGIACGNASLTIPFKEKKAVMRFWIGDWFAGQRRMWGTTPVIRLKVNGKTVHETKMTTENAYREWCRLDEYVYSRKDGIWERLVKPVLREYTVEVHNPDGKAGADSRTGGKMRRRHYIQPFFPCSHLQAQTGVPCK